MANEGLPITRSVLTWARERAGLSVEELSLQFKKLGEWEAGTGQPTYPQLEQLADRLKLPIAAFFFPEPPATPPIRQSFRTLTDQDFEAMPTRVRYLLRKAKAFQLNLVELNGEKNPAERLITRDLRFLLEAKIPEVAREVRHYLGVSLEQQTKWPSNEVALEAWREKVTEVGVFVFKDAFRVEDYSGFCLYDEEFPLVYVNNTSAKTRQMFTIFHELAHLLFHTSGIDTLSGDYVNGLPPEARRVEAICNRFAAEFLLPEAILRLEMQGVPATEETAEQIAGRFHVSRELIYRRYLDWGLVSQRDYEDAARRWAGQGKAGAGGDYYNTQLSYLGRRYVDLAFRRYRQNRINETQLADYLGMAPRYVAVLEDRLGDRLP